MSTLKERHTRQSLGRLCRLFGITRQAYYQYYWSAEEVSFEHKLVLDEVRRIRKSHPRMGGRKLYELLEPFTLEHQLKIGRDALFNLLAANQLLVRSRKRRVHTTNSFHWLRKYPNLIRELELTGSNQLWVSDITYWKTQSGYLYISLITDAYSHKIMGYQVAESLEAIETLKALDMALENWEPSSTRLIHHSDRGIQYCSSSYTSRLKNNGIQISMTENGDPLENALAERVNGIIKNEYLECYEVKDIEEAKELLAQVVRLYNTERPHMSIGNKFPQDIHNTNQKTNKLWKNYYEKKQDCKAKSGLTNNVNLPQD